MRTCPHCGEPSFSLPSVLLAGDVFPSPCPACGQPAYVALPLFARMILYGSHFVLGSLAILSAFVGYVWLAPLFLWLALLAPLLLRLLGSLRATVNYRFERFRPVRLWFFFGLPVLALLLYPILT